MNKDTIFKTTMYLLITTMIGVVSQLDGLGFDFVNIHANTWAGIIIKSTLPGLMTIKALFDIPNKAPNIPNKAPNKTSSKVKRNG